MATILTGYAYTTAEANAGCSLGEASWRAPDKLQAKAFDIDLSTPILKDHKDPVDARIVKAWHTDKGMAVEIRVEDDALAAKCKGFSIGYTVAGHVSRKMLEITLVCGEDVMPGNHECAIWQKRKAK